MNRDEVDYIDVSPKQLVSVAASLVPFLEHDDANRALMGANMQRQSVPLLVSEAPFVGTGMEGVTARDSGAVMLAAVTVSSTRSTPNGSSCASKANITPRSFRARSVPTFTAHQVQAVQPEHLHQPEAIVKKGERVVKGQVLADGPCTEQGELAWDVTCSWPSCRGAVTTSKTPSSISEKLVHEDYYTSVHIEEFEIEARDTKLGPEEITRDIPNVSEHALRDLDESGIIRIGARIKHDDILVGKVTPKGETQLTPEEKLLRAIFGEKAGDVRDASLTCPPGIEGTVVDVRSSPARDRRRTSAPSRSRPTDRAAGEEPR